MITRAVFSIAWAVGALSLAGPAHALLATKQSAESGDHVMVSAKWEAATTTLCDPVTYLFYYFQRVTIEGGRSEMVLVDHIYPTGRHELNLAAQCAGYNIFQVGTCGCSTQSHAARSGQPATRGTAAAVHRDLEPSPRQSRPEPE